MNIIDIALGDIVTGHSYRTAMVNIEELAANITEIGLLQPIGITPDRRLIFGGRRLAAFRLLKCETIPARIIEMDQIVLGTYAENEMRENFTVSERVAILKDVKNPRGRPKSDDANKDLYIKLNPRTAAVHAGFGSHPTAWEAEKVIDNGVPELIEAVDKNEISIQAGYIISTVKNPEEQKAIVGQSKEKRAAIVTDLRHKLRETTKAKKAGKKGAKPAEKKGGTGGAGRRLKEVYIAPTYTPNLTFEEQGFPPRETWDEPDEERPGLTKFQGHIAKHGHVHIMPLKDRQAQDARIAARKLSSQVRELKKQSVTAFVVGDLIDLATLDATLEVMTEDGHVVVRRLSDLLGDIMPALNAAHDYLTRLAELVERRKSPPVEEVASNVIRPAWTGAGS